MFLSTSAISPSFVIFLVKLLRKNFGREQIRNGPRHNVNLTSARSRVRLRTTLDELFQIRKNGSIISAIQKTILIHHHSFFFFSSFERLQMMTKMINIDHNTLNQRYTGAIIINTDRLLCVNPCPGYSSANFLTSEYNCNRSTTSL